MFREFIIKVQKGSEGILLYTAFEFLPCLYFLGVDGPFV